MLFWLCCDSATVRMALGLHCRCGLRPYADLERRVSWTLLVKTASCNKLGPEIFNTANVVLYQAAADWADLGSAIRLNVNIILLKVNMIKLAIYYTKIQGTKINYKICQAATGSRTCLMASNTYTCSCGSGTFKCRERGEVGLLLDHQISFYIYS